jgi:hypothetical protein
VLLPACKAISGLALSSTTNVAKLVTAGVHVSMINAITQHMDNVDAVRHSNTVLIRLSYSCTNKMRVIMGSDGVCEVLVKVLRVHIGHPSIVQLACTTVQNLAICDVTNGKLGNCGTCEAVVDALKANNSNEAAATAGCYAVENLAFSSKANQDKLKALGVYKVLKSVIKDYAGN